MSHVRSCPDCEPPGGLDVPDLEVRGRVTRRDFVRRSGVMAAAVSMGSLAEQGSAAALPDGETPERLVGKLYESLAPQQRERICFAWDHQDSDRGLLRTHVSNNWSVVDRARLNVGGDFFTADQRDLIEALFFGLYDPEWHDRIRLQLQDDAGGYGKAQTIAIFGNPADGKYQLVMTGRHCTIRCDGDTAEHVAFGGPIFYGHAARGFYEEASHPGNVYWPQALKANELYQMLDGKQRQLALVKPVPEEAAVGFRGASGEFPGIPIAELSEDQRGVARGVLASLLEPYRESSRAEARRLLDAQGGLEKCALSFYAQDAGGGSVDVGQDGVWDVWRIEGPSFVWHFRGEPHVHVWVNVADDPSIPLNAVG